MFFPFITLMRLADASNVSTDINVSDAKSSFPTTDKSFKEMETLGKWRKRERLTSLKSTFALRLLLICFFTRFVICFLNNRGVTKAKAIKKIKLMPVIFRVFFSIVKDIGLDKNANMRS